MDIVVAGLGGALVVFFAGATAAIAAGHTPPTELWAAGGAVSGGLLGLLAPSPITSATQSATAQEHAAAAQQHEAAAAQHEALAQQQAGAPAGAPGVAPGAAAASVQEAAQSHKDAAAEHTAAANAEAQKTKAPRMPAWLLGAVFLILLALSCLLASGHGITLAAAHSEQLKKPFEGLTNSVIALTSAAGSALVGMLAPSPSQGGAHK